MTIVDKELEVARHNLLDLTMRNQLLNFRSSKTRTIKVVDEIPREVYDRLVLQEKKMEFRPSFIQNIKYTQSADEKKLKVQNADLYADEASVLWKMPQSSEMMEAKHTDRFLQTTLKSEDLQKRMYYISQQSQSVLEEQGYTVLYLALGFLEWDECVEGSKLRRSPLVLIPVELSRAEVGGPFQLSWTGEDILTNISLQTKLIEYEIAFPEFEMPDLKDGLDQYYQNITNIISKKPNWKVLSEINLSFFSFTKFVMYKDLDPVAWPEDNSPSIHPLIKCIFDPDTQDYGIEFSEDDVDKKLNARNIYHVMDADPSQIAVIEDVKSGKNIVVEGPPGTGKSQTIANIIAELLAAEKTVLFVSEKMAALEVVKSRLEQVGLGDFCLELHSRKSNKKEVLKELKRTVSLASPKSVSLDSSFYKFENLKAELNDYAKALREPFGSICQSPFNLFCMKETALHHFENAGREIPNIRLSNAEQCSQKDWTEAISVLSNVTDVLPLVKPVNRNQWKGCSPGLVLPSDESEIEDLLDTCKVSLDELISSINGLCNLSSANIPLNLSEIESSILVSRVVALSKPVNEEVLLNQNWDKEPAAAPTLITKVRDFQKQRSVLYSKFREDVLENDIDALISQYKELSDKYPIIQFLDSKCIEHPWKVNSPHGTLPPNEKELEELIARCKKSFIDLENMIKRLCDSCSIHKPLTLEEIEPSISAARIIASSYPIDEDVLQNKEWNELNSQARSLIEKVELYKRLSSGLHSKFKEHAFEKDIDSIIKEYKELSASFFILRIFNSRYRYLKNEISSFYKDVAPKKIEYIISDLNELSTCIQYRKEIRDSSQRGKSLFGPYWKDENSDPQILGPFAEWIVSFRQKLLKDAFDDQVFHKISAGVSRKNGEKAIDDLLRAADHFTEQRDNLAVLIGISPQLLFSSTAENPQLENISIQLDSWKNGILEIQKWKNSIAQFYRTESPEKAEDIVSNLKEISDCNVSRERIRELNEIGVSFFGPHWRGEDSDMLSLNSFVEWMLSFRKHFLNKAYDDQICEKISAGVSKTDIEKSIDTLTKNKSIFIEKRDKLFARLNFNHEQIFGASIDTVPIEEMDSKLKLWKEGIPKIQKWGQFTISRDRCLNTFASPIVDLIDLDMMEPDDIIPCFRGNFAEDILRSAFKERSSLASFMGELHEKKIKDFIELDSGLIVENRQRLAHLLYKRQPPIPKGASPKSEAGILLGEFNRKRNHMPIRKLMTYTGGLIQKIKPCFMMSPLSIAQFLDPLNVNFDVVVFDEASQVRPEDSLGALLRANQCVIIGDTRQLPPTSFFDNMVDPTEETDEEITTSLSDIESILHLCKRSFLTKNLRWHYRSRHESLIAVSNQEFYDNRLVIYPSPIADMEHLGLKFVHLPDTVYDRGKTSVNRKEAKAVAKAALEHFSKYPDKSLGIGTFNIKQQQAIQEEVDMLLIEHPTMAKFFDSKHQDHFFVKNLETIQGDERDVIFISVGFGFDSDHKLSLHFGPLNQEGGERRLNVLITRAREKCVVFSNFKAHDLPTTQTSPFGVKSLKVFLEFAENRNLHSMYATGEDAGSPFEEAVYEFLSDCGYDVQKQVGCAGYRIDLAIIDHRYPGKYLLGIECDGVKYHSSQVARDRDRLRQQILEDLGWTIYRIWSTDWYRNKKECQVRLREFVEKTKVESVIPILTKKDQFTSSALTMNTGVEREKVTELPISDEDEFLGLVPEYKVCTSIDIPTWKQIHELYPYELEKAIQKILEIESPIHIDELIKRIRENHGLKRTGEKIRNAILDAVNYSENKNNLVKRGDFLWKDINDVNLRRRCNGVAAKIEMICDEEIAEAVKLVIRTQHATLPYELVVQTSRVFGIRSTSKIASERIEDVVNELISNDELKILSNGMVDLAEN